MGAHFTDGQPEAAKLSDLSVVTCAVKRGGRSCFQELCVDPSRCLNFYTMIARPGQCGMGCAGLGVTSYPYRASFHFLLPSISAHLFPFLLLLQSL
jgi:hypothetical protein